MVLKCSMLHPQLATSAYIMAVRFLQIPTLISTSAELPRYCTTRACLQSRKSQQSFHKKKLWGIPELVTEHRRPRKSGQIRDFLEIFFDLKTFEVRRFEFFTFSVCLGTFKGSTPLTVAILRPIRNRTIYERTADSAPTPSGACTTTVL